MNEKEFQHYSQKWSSLFEGKYGERYVASGLKDFEGDTDKWWGFFEAVLANADLKPESILDFGCGVGRFTDRLRRAYKVPTYGCDIVKGALKLAQERYPKCYFIHMDRMRIPIDVDMTFMCTTAGYIPDETLFKQSMDEINRVTKRYIIAYEHFFPANPEVTVVGYSIRFSLERFKEALPAFEFFDVEPPEWVPRSQGYRLLIGERK